MKLIITILFITISSFNVKETKVYICGMRGAKKYHLNESCRGFGACKHQITEVNLKEAQGYGLTLCGWED